MTDKLDLSKPLQTRGTSPDHSDGEPVLLLSTNGREPLPLVGYIRDSLRVSTWSAEGVFYYDGSQSKYDLINVPEKKRSGEVWVNVYPKDSIFPEAIAHSSRASANDLDKRAREQRIACARVTWTEGEGLEGE